MNAAQAAEDLMIHVPLPATGERTSTPNAVFSLLPGPYPLFATVARIRTTPKRLDELIADARRWFTARGREQFMWFLGPSSTPEDLESALIAHGAVPFSHASAMVLMGEPATGDVGVEVREVLTPAEFATFRELMFFDGEDGTEEQMVAVAEGHAQAWAEYVALGGRRRAFLAYANGEAVSGGGLMLTEAGVAGLAGGATKTKARGLGCYRALVQARWVAARAWGYPTLVVQASPMSQPILERFGFEVVAPLQVLRMSV